MSNVELFLFVVKLNPTVKIMISQVLLAYGYKNLTFLLLNLTEEVNQCGFVHVTDTALKVIVSRINNSRNKS